MLFFVNNLFGQLCWDELFFVPWTRKAVGSFISSTQAGHLVVKCIWMVWRSENINVSRVLVASKAKSIIRNCRFAWVFGEKRGGWKTGHLFDITSQSICTPVI